MTTQTEQLIALITEYLSTGGLFNPELMDHGQVRNLLIECRTHLKCLDDELYTMRRTAKELARSLQRSWDETDMGYIVDGSGYKECGLCGHLYGRSAEPHTIDCLQADLEIALDLARKKGLL